MDNSLPDCSEVSKEYWHSYNIPREKLFVSLISPHNPLKGSGIEIMIRTVARDAGIKKRVYPHLLRNPNLNKIQTSVVNHLYFPHFSIEKLGFYFLSYTSCVRLKQEDEGYDKLKADIKDMAANGIPFSITSVKTEYDENGNPAGITVGVLDESTGNKIYYVSQERKFFSLSENDRQYRQCFQLAEDGILDENNLDSAFKKIADSLKADQRYRENQLNICTFIIDAAGVKLCYEYFDKDAGIFQIKKAWKEKYLV